MSRQVIRAVNVIPYTKIKVEPLDEEDEDDCIPCLVCNKSFVSVLALTNHVRNEHFDVYLTGEKERWMGALPLVRPKIEPVTMDKIAIQKKTEEILSSMEPTNIMSLANEDVSYIIIKSETPVTEQKERERKRKIDKEPKEKVLLVEKKKEKEVQPITGPFECLQPSTLVAAGTCHQIFFSCCEYSQHFRDEHTRRRKGLRCQVCEKPLIGTGEEPTSPYPCEVCGQGFQTNRELSDHMAIDHIKLKPFECSICHKRFTQQGGVAQHMRMHTGDRPFSCIFCSKAFTQKSGLDQHLRIHTKVKPYRCVVCSKTFCQSVHLKQHMRTHTQVSPFQCGICHKRFKQSSHLNYHLKNHSTASMSSEQRTEYNKLISLINGPRQMEAQIILEDGEVLQEHDMGEVTEGGEVAAEVEETEEGEAEETTEEIEEMTEEVEEVEGTEEMTEELSEEIPQEEEEAETIIGDTWHVEYIEQ